MSKEIRITIVGEEDNCEICNKHAELRPYGPNGESICFECGMKNEKEVEKKFDELFDNTDILITGGQVIKEP